MHSILPRIEIPDGVLSSALDRESESTLLIDKGQPLLKHAHSYGTDHDANITTTTKTKRQHDYDSVHSDTSMKHVHVDNDKTMTNNSNSSAAGIGSAFTSKTTATIVQDNASDAEELGIEMCSDVLRIGWPRLQAALEKINFDCGLDNDSLWQKRYDELVAFKQRHGHCNVSNKDDHY